MLDDFNRDILEDIGHRPWPMPARPWVMTQTWHDLLFAHWPVDPAHVRDRVPHEFALDLFDGQAWIGVVPFHMTNVAPRLVPAVPWISAFPELNVRTYVRVEDKPGVFFFSLDAGSVLAVETARALLNLPYHTAAMEVALDGAAVRYRARRRDDATTQFAARYGPTGAAQRSPVGTLEYFLTERYCLYHLHRSGAPYRLDIHHPPWPLQPAEAEITANTMAAAAGVTLPARPPRLHFARRQDMVAWPPQALTHAGGR